MRGPKRKRSRPPADAGRSRRRGARNASVALVVIAGLVTWVAPARAQFPLPVCVRFIAVVDGGTLDDGEIELLDNTVLPGQALEGTYTLETTTMDFHGSPDIGVYPHRVWPYIMTVVAVPNAHVFQSEPLTTPSGENVLTHRIENTAARDLYQVLSTRNEPYLQTVQIDRIDLVLIDNTGGVFTNDAMLTTAPNLTAFDEAYLEIAGSDMITADPFEFRADLTLIEDAPCATIVADEMLCAEYEGIVTNVTDPNNLLGGTILVGDSFEGRYVFNAAAGDANPNSQIGRYDHLATVYGMLIDIMGTPFVTDPGNVDFPITIRDDLPGDMYVMESYNNLPMSGGVSVDSLLWDFRRDDGTAISNDAIFGPPDPAIWNDLDRVRIVGGANQQEGFEIVGNVLLTLPVPCDGGGQAPTDAAGTEGSRLSVRAVPNPFVRMTRIHFDVPRTSPTEIVVYDARGRKVRTLVRGKTLEVGPSSVVWDGKTADGQPAPRGVYFYRVHTAGRVHLGRVLLLK